MNTKNQIKYFKNFNKNNNYGRQNYRFLHIVNQRL